VTTSSITAGPLTRAFDEACAQLEQLAFVDALWNKRLDRWIADPGIQTLIANRLGWLTAIDFIVSQRPRLASFAEAVIHDGVSDVVLLGMGGSSLAPEVLRQVLGTAAGHPRLRVLDSVDPEAVRAAMADVDRSLFLLASKSGSTIEPNVMAAEARRRLLEAGQQRWGSRFIAITDPETGLHRQALSNQFRDVFINPSDIGGRYSALSFFGMVPAALLGIDLDTFITRARTMETACRATRVADNPGVSLGALMAASAANGRDKLTLLLPARLQSLGLWIEQLVAESTGKHGKGIVPIAGEPGDARFGDDRMFVIVNVADQFPDRMVCDRARASGNPVVTLHMDDALDLGAEFLRWEVATAVAGRLLSINPFDEPNVQQAKDATRALLEGFRRDRRLPLPETHAEIDGMRLTLSEAAQATLAGAPATAFLDAVRAHDYVALLAFLPPDDPRFVGPLDSLRSAVGATTGCATMFGYGPRYLHSTGQLHKGGANTGVFIVITADPDDDLEVPGEAFSFGVLETAQALGDFQSLDRAGRRALFVQAPRRDAALLAQLTASLTRGR
jgi:transaldolase/glucose-6-phosphate isomerase